ncbi:hypothetical protein [Pseudomonas aeruginosa]
MSSTQHQLIEQCAIRLRGIVEALDNIHDTSPHRWSTDLDDVHSSAESLLALIKDQAPARSEASFEEWLANELEGEDGQPVPAAVCDIALARRAFNHWPKLEQPAKVGGVRFSAGVSSRLVVEAAQRLCEFESTPEKEAERIERLQAFREQLDPLNLTPHAEAFNEAPAEALRPEQAEAERPEVVGYLATAEHPKHGQPHKAFNYFKDQHDAQVAHWRERGCTVTEDRLMTVSQHERIVGALRSEIAEWQEAAGRSRSDVVAYIAERAKLLEERDAAQARVAGLEAELETERMRLAGCGTAALGYFDGCADAYKSASLSDVLRLRADCDAALARVAELERQEPVVRAYGVLPPFAEKVLAKLRRFYDCAEDFESGGVDIGRHWLDLLTQLGLLNRVQRSPALWEISQHGEDLLEAPVAQAGQMPQAWLDVQAERRRQITAEGWTPERDDEHSHGQMARAAACYALAGSSAPSDGTAALLVSLAWPWDEQWWKPSTARRDMVKACALALAEIERLDRATATQGGPRDA